MRDRQGTRKPSTREIAIALLSFVVLLGAPALCLSGVLEHPCNCSDNVGGNCSHESDCPDDPCRVVAKDRPHVETLLPTFEFAVAAILWNSELALPQRCLIERPSSSLPHRKNLPCHLSDIPLLR